MQHTYKYARSELGACLCAGGALKFWHSWDASWAVDLLYVLPNAVATSHASACKYNVLLDSLELWCIFLFRFAALTLETAKIVPSTIVMIQCYPSECCGASNVRLFSGTIVLINFVVQRQNKRLILLHEMYQQSAASFIFAWAQWSTKACLIQCWSDY
jgi:hypothetical protein